MRNRWWQSTYLVTTYCTLADKGESHKKKEEHSSPEERNEQERKYEGFSRKNPKEGRGAP